MGAIRKLDITLEPDQAKLVEDAVTAGDFASPNDVVAAALELWQASRANDGMPDVETLRKAAEEGLDSGDSEFATMADLRAEIARRYPDLARR